LKKKRNVKLKPNVLNFFKTGLIRVDIVQY